MPEQDDEWTWTVRYNPYRDTEPDEGVTRSNSSPTVLDQDSFERLYRLVVNWSRGFQDSWTTRAARSSHNEPSDRLSASSRVDRINALCVHYGLTPGLFAHLTRERYSWRLNGHLAGEWAYVPCLASEASNVFTALDIIERRIGGTS